MSSAAAPTADKPRASATSAATLPVDASGPTGAQVKSTTGDAKAKRPFDSTAEISPGGDAAGRTNAATTGPDAASTEAMPSKKAKVAKRNNLPSTGTKHVVEAGRAIDGNAKLAGTDAASPTTKSIRESTVVFPPAQATEDIPSPTSHEAAELLKEDNTAVVETKPAVASVTGAQRDVVAPAATVPSVADSNAVADDSVVPSVSTSPLAQSAEKSTAAALYSIRDLTPQLTGRWTFIARVLSRGSVHEYTNLRGAGRLSEIHVSDSLGDTIRVTLFNSAVTKFHDVLLPGASCCFSDGRIKLAAFAPIGATYEVTFGDDAVIAPVEKEKEIHAEPSFQFIPLSQLTALTSRAQVTVAGVVHAVGTVKRTATAKGNTVDRCEFALVDDSATKAFCTCWGRAAHLFGESARGRALLVIGAQVSDHNGSRSLNIGFGATILLDVDVAKTRDLRAWYAALPPDFAFAVIGA